MLLVLPKDNYAELSDRAKHAQVKAVVIKLRENYESWRRLSEAEWSWDCPKY